MKELLNNFVFLIADLVFKYFFPVYKLLYFKYKKINEKDKINYLKNIIKPGMVIIDIGANIGFFTVLFSKLIGDNGKVFSFEPDNLNFKYLKRNTKRLMNVVLNNLAVAQKSGQIKLYVSDNLNVDHHTYQTDEKRKSISLNSVSLDEYFSENQNIDLIKIDVQGFDYYVLKGSQNILSRSMNLILFCEIWPYGLNNSKTKPSEFISLIENSGFKIEYFDKEANKEFFDSKITDKSYYSDFIATKNTQKINS